MTLLTELMVMANDAHQAGRHLQNMPDADTLKRQMVEQIIGERTIPTKLQFALSQRLYYEELMRGHLFWAQNDPSLVWLSGMGDRRRYMLHWAVYDSQVNLPTIYLMELEDSGRTPLAIAALEVLNLTQTPSYRRARGHDGQPRVAA